MFFQGPSNTPTFILAKHPIAVRLALISGILLILLVAAMTFSVANGSSDIPYGDVARILLKGLGVPGMGEFSDAEMRIVNMVRLPRVLVGALVGAALAVSGATMQGLFRNPLADPGIIGVSAGSALGAVIALAAGFATGSLWTLPFFAFLGGMSAATTVYILSLVNGRTQIPTLLLAGVALNSLLGAITSTIMLLGADFGEVQAILTWLVGGLRGRGTPHLEVLVLPTLVCILLLYASSRDLNLLLLGEETAQGLGVNVPRTRFGLLMLTSLLTGTAVSMAGGIGFIGLIVPHALRLIVGPDHRVLLPASALGGAVFLVICDTVARLVIRPAEIQVGLITAMLGAPFFLFLLWRSRHQMAAL